MAPDLSKDPALFSEFAAAVYAAGDAFGPPKI